MTLLEEAALKVLQLWFHGGLQASGLSSTAQVCEVMKELDYALHQVDSVRTQ